VFGFSFWEVFLILVVALLVIGPERLPGVARKAGEWTYKVRKFVANAKAEMDSEFNMQDMKQLLNSQESEISKLRAMVEETRHDLDDTGHSMKSALTDAERTMRESATAERDRLDPAGESSTSRLGAIDSTETHTPDDAFEDELSRLQAETGETIRRPFDAAEPDTPAAPEPDAAAQTTGHDERPERRSDN
jgi:sec-independent protein translocase protein TatB